MHLSSCEIRLLIGYNCSRALLPREVIPPSDEGPFGKITDLGWGIVGILQHSEVEEDSIGLSHQVLAYEVPSAVNGDGCAKSVLLSVRTSVKEVICSDVLRLMEREFHDSGASDAALSQEDRQFLSILRGGIHFRDGKYEMPLPFKKPNPVLPKNRSSAVSRLRSIQRKFITDEHFKEQYCEFMSDLVRKGHAERVPDGDIKQDTAWYIPHHGVYHPQKPNKIRVVFDCSATYQGHSLNQHLQGPDLTNKLVGVLCRFRKEHVTFMCDVEQMFYQFRVSPECREYLRVLWWDSDDFTRDPVDYRMNVHLFGATSSPGCANFGLKQLACDQESAFGSHVSQFIHRDFYVDDGVKSVQTESEAIYLIERTGAMCSTAGLRLHKFVSNSRQVVQSVNPNDRAKNLEKVDLTHKLPVERALGVSWCTESDTFQFHIILKDRPLTRRGILSSVSCLYDPLGLIAPVVLQGKQILQQMYAENADWDDPLPEHLRTKWLQWRESLESLSSLKVRRCLKPDDFGEVTAVELHHFSDASTVGYGQCSYIRMINQDNQIHCSLLMGKSRVVPLRPITIPRLELVAALLSIKTGSLLQRELDYDNVKHIYWTDSKVVLGYIGNESRRFHVCVANRVQQIRDSSEPSQWHFVGTKEKPADIASRGLLAHELVEEPTWLHGPEFIWKPELPTTAVEDRQEVNPDDQELRRTGCFTAVVDRPGSCHLLDRLQAFSDWNIARKAVALCLSLKTGLLNRSIKKPQKVPRRDVALAQYVPVTVEEMRLAETEIFKLVQSRHFSSEISSLKREGIVGNPSERKEMRSRKEFLKKGSSLYHLDPFIDSTGVLRVGGRVQHAEFSDALKHPILLPKQSHVTTLVVRHFHEKVEHQGRGMTTNVMRANGVWIVGCSSVVSSHISKCVTCRRIRSKAQGQKMSDLPSDRLEQVPPFTYCAVDLFGPWYIKEGRKEMKRYGVLFTCLSCQAVHVETVNSLETDSFINCVRRFIAIRGPLRQLRCDRGTNFVGAERELQEALQEMDASRVRDILLRENCDYLPYKMNVPAASHMGGVWERQIRPVRNVLDSLLLNHGSQLNDESLRTFLLEAGAIVNSRPLSFENLNDPLSVTPLTPNHLVTMKAEVVLPPPGNFQKPDVYCRKQWRRTQYMVNEFWKRWRTEFLQGLQVRSKWESPRRNMCVGDVVVLKDENLACSRWRLGRMQDVSPDSDGLVRKVGIVLSSSCLDAQGRRTRTLTYLERPIHKLILLLETEEFPIEEP